MLSYGVGVLGKLRTQAAREDAPVTVDLKALIEAAIIGKHATTDLDHHPPNVSEKISAHCWNTHFNHLKIRKLYKGNFTG